MKTNFDRYFYSIELDDNNNKIIHWFGNLSYNDAWDNYCLVEWTFLYMDTKKAQHMWRCGTLQEHLSEMVTHITDMGKMEAVNICMEFFNGRPGKELHISEITNDTPCGDYWFE